MPKLFPRWRRKAGRLFKYTRLSFALYRYRYLAIFTAIGFLSILLEVGLTRWCMPASWPWLLKAGLAFLVGLGSSFALNTWVNFRVPRGHRWRTFARFTAVSVLSFSLNMLLVQNYQVLFGPIYGQARLVSASVFFLLAYYLHRRFTFDLSRNFGIAVYASASERVFRIYRSIGRNCDHVHVDLIDATMSATAAPVDLDKLRLVRKLWRGLPVCLHVMSRRPAKWLEQAGDQVDWFLFHLDSADDPHRLILECRRRNKKVGIVCHESVPFEAALPLLPHVDFVMVLAIAQPGRSGQKASQDAIALTATLDDLRGRYGFELMFDGGVTPGLLPQIRARYIVAASAVLSAANPVLAAHSLRTSVRYERIRAA